MFWIGFIVGGLILGSIMLFVGANNAKSKFKTTLDGHIADATAKADANLQGLLTQIKAKL